MESTGGVDTLPVPPIEEPATDGAPAVGLVGLPAEGDPPIGPDPPGPGTPPGAPAGSVNVQCTPTHLAPSPRHLQC